MRCAHYESTIASLIVIDHVFLTMETKLTSHLASYNSSSSSAFRQNSEEVLTMSFTWSQSTAFFPQLSWNTHPSRLVLEISFVVSRKKKNIISRNPRLHITKLYGCLLSNGVGTDWMKARGGHNNIFATEFFFRDNWMAQCREFCVIQVRLLWTWLLFLGCSIFIFGISHTQDKSTVLLLHFILLLFFLSSVRH